MLQSGGGSYSLKEKHVKKNIDNVLILLKWPINYGFNFRWFCFVTDGIF